MYEQLDRIFPALNAPSGVQSMMIVETPGLHDEIKRVLGPRTRIVHKFRDVINVYCDSKTAVVVLQMALDRQFQHTELSWLDAYLARRDFSDGRWPWETGVENPEPYG